MVGTGANRMPLTKIHPILLGQQKSGNEGGGSLLAHHRQQHQERLQQMGSPSSGTNQMGGPPRGYGPPNQQYRGPPPNQQMQYPPPNMYQQQQPRHLMSYNQNMQSSGFGQQTFNQPPQNINDSQSKQFQNNLMDNGQKKKRKRPSRWGAKDDKAVVTGLITLPADLTEEQRKHYLIQFKIEEITQKLRTGELGIPADPTARSPSPEPIYNSEGKRLNTREYRVRKKLEDERHGLIKQAIEDIPDYKPPVDYKPPTAKIYDKVYIPAERNPAVNFIGLLIGPRGNTLKRLEKDTGCKIIIRGKGSVKEGKVGRIPGQLMPGEDEPLHALITGPTEKEVKKGVEVVTEIVKEGIECPDAANELRRNQLRELAELNGTLIDDEIIKCKNCGAVDHRHWECQEQKNVTSTITCHKCGGYGHVAVDCTVKPDSNFAPQQTFSEKAKMDTEYMSLMVELGVDAPPPPPKRSFHDQPPQNLHEPPKEHQSRGGSRPDQGRDSYTDRRNEGKNNEQRDGGRRRSENRWGPPAGGSPVGPKSLMDVNVGSNGSPNQFRGPRPGGPSNHSGPRPGGPSNHSGPPNQGAPPWINQQRGPRPMMQGPPQGGGPPSQSNNGPPPWQQGPPRGPPPAYGANPPPAQNSQGAGMNQPTSYPQGPWQQQQTGYPNQWLPYGFNPYQQMSNTSAPPPPWSQQPPPPPPPPPPSSG